MFIAKYFTKCLCQIFLNILIFLIVFFIFFFTSFMMALISFQSNRNKLYSINYICLGYILCIELNQAILISNSIM